MKVFLTGATGYVGTALALKLAEAGMEVNALARSSAKATALRHPNIQIVEGDVQNPEKIRAAMEGCKGVYHLAAFAGIWTDNPTQYEIVNVQGTLNVLEAAKQAGVSKVVITSTGGVMGPSPAKGILVDETTNPQPELASGYERSKLKAERLVFSFLEKGLETVVVNPTRIYGPGELKESNSVTKLVKQFHEGKWRMIPGDGNSIGNYVFLDDVVEGHLLAMDKGKPGERYILGGDNVSYNELFELLRQLTGQQQQLFRIPLSVMVLFARYEVGMATLFGKKPLIVPEFVRKLSRHWSMSSAKAQQELGYVITPLESGLKKTLEWIQNNSN